MTSEKGRSRPSYTLSSAPTIDQMRLPSSAERGTHTEHGFVTRVHVRVRFWSASFKASRRRAHPKTLSSSDEKEADMDQCPLEDDLAVEHWFIVRVFKCNLLCAVTDHFEKYLQLKGKYNYIAFTFEHIQWHSLRRLQHRWFLFSWKSTENVLL